MRAGLFVGLAVLGVFGGGGCEGGFTVAASGSSSVSGGAAGAGGAGGSASSAGGSGGEAGVCGNGAVEPGEQCDDGNNGADDGCAACQAEPVDGCAPEAAAIVLDKGSVVVVSGDTTAATNDGACDCGSSCTSGEGPDVSYAVTATHDGAIFLELAATDHHKVVYAGSDCPPPPTGIGDYACYDPEDDDGGTSAQQFDVVQGETYWVFVDGFGDPGAGAFELTLTMVTCGDGVRDGYEDCDDGNTVDDGNGCGPDCESLCPDPGDDVFGTAQNEHCYRPFTQLVAWDAARIACQSLAPTGAWHLVALGSVSERDFADALDLVTSSEAMWTGGNDAAVEGTFVWSNGEPWWDEATWASTDPNGDGDCVALSYVDSGEDNDELFDRDCAADNYYLCELALPGQ